MIITGLSFANGQSLNPTEMQPISQNKYIYNYQWQKILTIQYIMLSVNRALTIFDVASWAIRLLTGCGQL